jgi:hypothetical protein
MLNKSRLVLALTLLTVIPACGSNPLSLLTGGGPNVNAPIAAGQEVEQTQGISVKTEAPSVSLRPKSRVDKVDQSQTTNQELPGWVWVVFGVLFVVGWATDTPATMVRQVVRGKDYG